MGAGPLELSRLDAPERGIGNLHGMRPAQSADTVVAAVDASADYVGVGMALASEASPMP